MSDRKIQGIEFLRGIAANMVVLFHFQQTALLEKYSPENDLDIFHPFRNLSAGVDLFFVISGFIMFYISDSRFISKKAFLLSRLLRIVPLYWLMTILQFVISNIFSQKGLTASHLFQSLLFNVDLRQTLPVLSQGWTLQYEMLFYFVFSLVLTLPFSKKFYFVSVLFLISRAIFPVGNILIEFLYGGFAFLLAKRCSKVVSTLLFSLSLFGFIFSLNVYSLPNSSLKYFFFGLPAISIVSFLGAKRDGFPRILTFIGYYSYSLYLTHTFVISVVFKVFYSSEFFHHNPYLFLVLGILACNLIGYLSWKFIEYPVTSFFNLKLREVLAKE